MVDFHSAKDIVAVCFWVSAGVSVLYVLEITLGDFARERVRRFIGRDDTGQGKKL
jgi:hypothetical protein